MIIMAGPSVEALQGQQGQGEGHFTVEVTKHA
jgi:hypothetical protein